MRTPILAYWFDEACAWHGSFIESKLNERTKSGKPKHDLEDLLGVRKYHLFDE